MTAYVIHQEKSRQKAHEVIIFCGRLAALRLILVQSSHGQINSALCLLLGIEQTTIRSYERAISEGNFAVLACSLSYGILLKFDSSSFVPCGRL